MSLFIILITFLSHFSLQAASISVAPFKLSLAVEKGFELTGEIELACRYEKFVFGDSAEYETFTKTPTSLVIKSLELNDEYNRVTIENPRALFFEYNSPFKYGKECRASYRVRFTSTKYALGHGRRPLEPVSFLLWKGFYDYQEGDQIWDLKNIKDYLHNTNYSFSQQITEHALIIRILQDGREASTSPWVQKAVFNPQTGKPFRPKD